MNLNEAKLSALHAASYFETQSAGYKSWGHVEVLQIALKISKTQFVLTDENKKLTDLSLHDIQVIAINSSTTLGQLFLKRKSIETILITHQEFASKVKNEIPPILDDQAQLLGITVRIAKGDADIITALNGRFAVVLHNGKSICIGTTIEDVYVAAQLLEKTAKVFIEAEYIGGAKPINRMEAWFMHQYYRFKYSKEAKKNK